MRKCGHGRRSEISSTLLWLLGAERRRRGWSRDEQDNAIVGGVEPILFSNICDIRRGEALVQLETR